MVNSLKLSKGLNSVKALSGSSILFIAMMLVNVLNYGYALVLGRFLGPSEYAAYASFISLFLLISLIPLTLQQVTAKYSAQGQDVVAYSTKLALIAGGFVGLALSLGSAYVANLIRLPQSWLIGLGLLIPLYAALGVLRGDVQGKQKLSLLGQNMVLEHLSKIVLTPLSFLLFSGASAAVVATLTALPATLAQLKGHIVRTVVDKGLRKELRRYALPVFFGLAAQAIIINSDVLMANALLTPEDSGLYAATSLLGRVVFYASWAVSAAVFPMVAARHKEGKPDLSLLYAALGAVAFISLGVTGFCALFPDFVINLLFGEAYLAAASLIAPYALATTLYALANVVSSHYLALGRHLAGYLPLLGAAAQVALIALFHSSSLELIWMQMVAKGGLFVLLVLAAWFGLFKPKDNYVLR